MVVASFGLSLGTAVLTSVTAPLVAAVRAPLTMTAAEAPADDVLLAGQSDIIVERFVLRAGRENMTVDMLSFQNCLTGDTKDYDGDCADTDETAGDDDAIAQIALLYNDGTYDRKSRGTIVDGVATFQNLSLALSAGVDVPVSLRIATAAIDSSTVTSGDQFQLNLNALTLPFHAVTTRHATVIDETSVKKNVIGSVRTLRQTLATLTLSSTAPAVTINDDWSEAFRVDVSATSTGAATLNELTLALDIINNGGGNWNTCPFLGASADNYSLVNVATGAAVDATWDVYDVDGTACSEENDDAVGYFHITFTTPESIPAGTVVTYAFYLDATYANTTAHDILRVSIPEEDDADLPTGVHAIVWTDGVSTDDIDGTEIDSLPVVGNLLTF